MAGEETASRVIAVGTVTRTAGILVIREMIELPRNRLYCIFAYISFFMLL